jgi:hypothetical protein
MDSLCCFEICKLQHGLLVPAPVCHALDMHSMPSLSAPPGVTSKHRAAACSTPGELLWQGGVQNALPESLKALHDTGDADALSCMSNALFLSFIERRLLEVVL